MTAKVERLLELDGLRGLAVLGVVLYHFTYRYHFLYGHSPDFGLRLYDGRHGVTVLFMISGFVIPMTVDRGQHTTDFILARSYRLFPAYWCAVLISYAVFATVGLPGRNVDSLTALVNLTMLQEFLSVRHVDGAYGFLTILICFYAFVAFALALGMRRHLLLMLSLSVVVGLALHLADARMPIDDFPGWDWMIARTGVVHLFLMGVVLYEIRSGWHLRHACVFCLCVLSAFCTRSHLREFSVVIVLMLLMTLATQVRVPLLANRFLLFTGGISYSLFLVHQNIGYVIIRACYARGLSGYWGLIFAIAVTGFLAVLVTYLVERPANSYLRRKHLGWRKAKLAFADCPAATVDGVTEGQND